MKVHMIEQRSEEWFDVKRGKFGATDMATVANGKPATLKTLVFKKAAELITGYREEGYINEHMLRGIELEDQARQLYEFLTGQEVDTVGFIEFDEYSGCSPDGLVGEDGGVEIKCKDIHTHLQCLLYGDNSYMWQIQSSLFFTGRKWWDFVSYNEHFPPEKQLYVYRHYPDPVSQKKIEIGLGEAVRQLVEVMNTWKAL